MIFMNYSCSKIIISLILIFYMSSSKADSPITSTNIDSAYTDIEMVKYAKKLGKIDEKIANYLHSTDVKIDIKAAVINAVGWNINGTKNAESYSQLVFSEPLKNLNLNTLEADDLFCLGYLQVMDDYFNPKKAMPYIKKAKKLKSESFTVAIIYALIQAQDMMDDQGKWCDIWLLVKKVLDDENLTPDMRADAIKIIKDYMILYKC